MDDLFAGGTKPEPPVIDPEKDYFLELVGEGKKYKDSAAVARAILEKDRFIDQLKQEASEARQESLATKAELATRARLEELLDRATTSKKETPPGDDDTRQPDGSSQTLDPNKIAELVEGIVSKRESARQVENNLDYVAESLEKTFGSDWKADLERKRQELNLSKEEMNAIAMRNPKGFLTIVGAPSERTDPTKLNGSPPPRSVNTDATSGLKSGVRDASFYRDLKVKDPALYKSAKIEIQMHKDAMELGEAFFN